MNEPTRELPPENMTRCEQCRSGANFYIAPQGWWHRCKPNHAEWHAGSPDEAPATNRFHIGSDPMDGTPFVFIPLGRTRGASPALPPDKRSADSGLRAAPR